jgi:hypothetical protein
MRVARAGFVGVATLVSGCVPAMVVPDLGRAEALIQECVAAGGREDPSASYYLALAERELARARALFGVHDAEGARGWARRARADAEVARLCAIEVAVRESARRTEADAAAIERRIEAQIDGRPPLLAPSSRSGSPPAVEAR